MPNTILSYPVVEPGRSVAAELGNSAMVPTIMSQCPAVPTYNWSTLLTAPGTFDGASDGVAALTPLTLSTSSHNRIQNPLGRTQLAVRLKYPSSVSAVGTAPVVELYGVDGNSIPVAHKTVGGSVTATLTAVVATDKTNEAGTFRYTDFVVFDVSGSFNLMAAVKTALAATGATTGAVVEARLL
jgi:hypothetical protein